MEFYLKLVQNEKYSSRELERQISSGTFERVLIGNQKLSAVLRESNAELTDKFKDSYVFEFLNLSEPHNERDLQQGVVRQMKNFILNLEKTFCL